MKICNSISKGKYGVYLQNLPMSHRFPVAGRVFGYLFDAYVHAVSPRLGWPQEGGSSPSSSWFCVSIFCVFLNTVGLEKQVSSTSLRVFWQISFCFPKIVFWQISFCFSENCSFEYRNFFKLFKNKTQTFFESDFWHLWHRSRYSKNFSTHRKNTTLMLVMWRCPKLSLWNLKNNGSDHRETDFFSLKHWIFEVFFAKTRDKWYLYLCNSKAKCNDFYGIFCRATMKNFREKPKTLQELENFVEFLAPKTLNVFSFWKLVIRGSITT